MVAIKAAEVDAFIARRDSSRPVILVFGPDAGLVSERVSALVADSVDDPNDPFALARLDGEDIAAEPARLIDEALTIPLFGGRRTIWVKAGARSIAPAVENLLALGGLACRVVIEAGDLRPNAPLRAAVERAKNAAALPCYVDDQQARNRLIDEEMRAAGLTISADARALLLPLIGGDRAASRSEIAKIALYARGHGEVSADDVAAVVADASGLTLDDIVDAAFAGRPAEVEFQLAKARVAGSAPGSILFAAQRQVAQLHKWRTAIENREPFSLDTALPRAQFRRKPAIESALKSWTAARLAATMADLAEAALQARRNTDLSITITARALLSIAANQRRKAA